jgi:6-phosphogluconolactonase (cycloisomerase 2 family)
VETLNHASHPSEVPKSPQSKLLKFVNKIQISAFIALFSLCPAAEQWAFLSLGKDQRIQNYRLHDDGSLGPVKTFKTEGQPSCMALSQNHRRLYVALKKSQSIAAYQVGKGATLTLLGTTSVGEDPSFLSVHPSGKYLLSSYYQAGKAAIHRIKPDGSLSGKPSQMIETDERAHTIALDPSGNFAFVP